MATQLLLRCVLVALVFCLVVQECGARKCFLIRFLRRLFGRCDRPRDCRVSQWSQWSHCSHTCGGHGYQTRTREVIQRSRCRGKCGPVYDMRECNRFCQNGGSLVSAGPHLNKSGLRDETCACATYYHGECCESFIRPTCCYNSSEPCAFSTDLHKAFAVTSDTEAVQWISKPMGSGDCSVQGVMKIQPPEGTRSMSIHMTFDGKPTPMGFNLWGTTEYLGGDDFKDGDRSHVKELLDIMYGAPDNRSKHHCYEVPPGDQVVNDENRLSVRWSMESATLCSTDYSNRVCFKEGVEPNVDTFYLVVNGALLGSLGKEGYKEGDNEIYLNEDDNKVPAISGVCSLCIKWE